jgi:hypothetical protein
VTSLLTAVVLVASYSAGIVSYLTLRTPSLPFKDFKGVLQDGSFQLGMIRDGAKLDYFKVRAETPFLPESFNRFIT